MKGKREVRSSATLGVVALAVALFGVSSALAVHDGGLFELGDGATPLTVGSGDILGDSSGANGPDWADLFDSGGASLVGSSATFVSDELSQGGGTDETHFAESNKNNDLIATWNWSTGNEPPKDDLANVYTYATFDGADLIVYTGLERLSNDGASHVDFQFYRDEIRLDKAPPCGDDLTGGPDDKQPCEFTGERQEGDFVVTMDFTEGGEFGSVEIRVWDGDSYEVVPAGSLAGEGCNGDDTVCAVNNGDLVDGGPWPNFDRLGDTVSELERNQFTEVGVNVSRLLGETPCVATFVVKTRSAPAFTSELKDFTLAPFNSCPTTGGEKFNDLDRDGVRDQGEPDLAGWTIQVYADDGDAVLGAGELEAGPVASDVTDSSGEYLFTLEPGEYVVCEALQTGWKQSLPSGNSACAGGAGLAPAGYALHLVPNRDEEGNDFGNFVPAPPPTPAPPAPPPSIDVQITKVDLVDPVTVGDEITYVETVTNNGPAGATGVVVTDPPPSQVTFVSASTTQGGCSFALPVLTCDLGSLATRASATITLVVRANEAGSVHNEAVVVAREPESNTANNRDDEDTNVRGPLLPPSVCARLTLSINALTVGRKAALRIIVRDQRGKPMRGVKVAVRGVGVRASGRTNRSGVLRVTVTPRRPGVLRVTVPGSTRCETRVGVVGIFQPPVTG